MKSALKKLQYIENLIIVVSFAVMVTCSFLSVVNRNFIKLSIPWFDELSTFTMIYMALLGTEAGLRDGSQIAVTALVNKFNGISKAILQIIAKTVVTGFSAVVLYYSCHMAAIQASSGQLTAALHIPMAIPYFALVISFAIITCVQGITVITMLVHFNELSNPHTVDEKGGD